MQNGNDSTRVTTSLRARRRRCARMSLGPPVGDPQAAVVPPRRLAERQALQDHVRLVHRTNIR